MPQKETLDRAAYTCMLVSYRRLSPQFQFFLSGVTLVYLSQWHRQCVTVGEGGWGSVEMYCGPYSAGVLHSVSDQIQNLQNCFTTPNKMTSEDDITGLVSLKFLCPCVECSVQLILVQYYLYQGSNGTGVVKPV